MIGLPNVKKNYHLWSVVKARIISAAWNNRQQQDDANVDGASRARLFVATVNH
jgi:hypothetical protein